MKLANAPHCTTMHYNFAIVLHASTAKAMPGEEGRPTYYQAAIRAQKRNNSCCQRSQTIHQLAGSRYFRTLGCTHRAPQAQDLVLVSPLDRSRLVLLQSRPMRLVSLLPLVLLTACSTPAVWYQPGKTAAQTHQDLVEAKLTANQIDNKYAPIGGLVMQLQNKAAKNDLIENSMRAKGYAPTPQTQVPDGSQYPRK